MSPKPIHLVTRPNVVLCSPLQTSIKEQSIKHRKKKINNQYKCHMGFTLVPRCGCHSWTWHHWVYLGRTSVLISSFQELDQQQPSSPKLSKFRRWGWYFILGPSQQQMPPDPVLLVLSLPYSLIALFLNLDLLASSDTSQILLNRSFLSLPIYPRSLSSPATDLAGNPRLLIFELTSPQIFMACELSF